MGSSPGPAVSPPPGEAGGQPGGVDVAAGEDDPDPGPSLRGTIPAAAPSTPPVGDPGAQGGQAEGGGRLDQLLGPRPAQGHGVQQLGVGDGDDVVHQAADDLEGALADAQGADPVGHGGRGRRQRDAPPGPQRRLGVGGGGRLDPDDPGRGRAALDRGRGPRDQPAPAHRDQHQVQVGHVGEQLEGGRALPGHDVVVVEGVDNVQAALGGQVGGEGLAVVAGDTLHDHLGPVGPGGGHLGRVGAGRHDHHRPAAGLGRGQGDRLAVVAGADRQHPGGPPAGVEGEQGVERPPGLERPHPLQVLGLEGHPAAQLPVEQPRGQHRGPVDPPGDPGRGLLHIGHPEPMVGGVRGGAFRPTGRSAAHPAAATTALAARSASSAVTS
jgi:hypothetical protein